jgi:hypothetical protein
MNGGEVIASGGFGCVFKPSLKCKGKTREKSKITKLMTKKHTLAEYNEIKKYSKILKKVPKYKDYYLIDNVTLCQPAKLSDADLSHYTTKCSALQKDNFTKTNINKNSAKLMALNMPDGGEDLGDYIDTVKYSKMSDLNNLLIDLLVHGIVPMNKLGVFHSDIKDSNILMKDKVRLIDWGLSTTNAKNSKTVPRMWESRPFQYNVPFSSILFNTTFNKMYAKFLEINKSPSREEIRIFVIDYIYAWTSYRGAGHFSAINRIFRNLYSEDLINVQDDSVKEDIIKFDITFNTIVEHLTLILETYTKSGKINLMSYMNNVFAKNIDIWGFIMCYNSIAERLFVDYSKLNKSELELFSSLKKIFNEYLFKPRVKPIEIKQLVVDLKNLNPIFDKCSSSEANHSFNGKASGLNTDMYNTLNILNMNKLYHQNLNSIKSRSSRSAKTRKITLLEKESQNEKTK